MNYNFIILKPNFYFYNANYRNNYHSYIKKILHEGYNLIDSLKN